MSDTPFMDVRVSSWDAAKTVLARLGGFVFRGQSDCRWSLSTTLERAVQRAGLGLGSASVLESLVLRQFQRRAHHFIHNPPPIDREIEWLALIQHHGGPTRLLDFTHSPYVAAFFAMELSDCEAVVWCVNRQALTRRIAELFGTEWTRDHLALNLDHVEIAQQLIRHARGATGVLWVEPDRLNERMATQQGIFLMPCKVGESFAENLVSRFALPRWYLEEPPTHEVDWNASEIPRSQGVPLQNAVLLKLRLPRVIHADAVRDLDRMNVNATSLFGGIDGFARSLHSVFKPFEAHYVRYKQ